MKPPRQMPAVDAILDAVSASYTIGPARIALIHNTVLYPLCVHAIAAAIASHTGSSSQQQVWFRLNTLGNVDFAVDSVYYNKAVYPEICDALQGEELIVVSEDVKRIWQRHGLLPYAHRDEATKQQMLKLIADHTTERK